jgi:hypothetical protein
LLADEISGSWQSNYGPTSQKAHLAPGESWWGVGSDAAARYNTGFVANFLDQQRTLENYWRAVILFGQNVASYKFALGKSLIELSAAGQSAVSLEELADPFSRHIVEHLGRAPKQGTSPPAGHLTHAGNSSTARSLVKN